MDIQIEIEGTPYKRIGDDWYEASTRVPRSIARKLNARLREVQETTSPIRRKSTIHKVGQEDSTFRHAETFSIIADLIRKASKAATHEFIPHQDIMAAFLAHPEGLSLAEEAAEQQGSTVEQVASNMVAGFSKHFTEGETPYQNEFERERVEEDVGHTDCV